MTYHQNSSLGAAADCTALAAAAKESLRVAQTMVRVNQMGSSNEKTAAIAQLLRDWSTGTGESWADMEARYLGKKNAAAAALVAAVAKAAESNRVYQTMVRTRRLGGSPAKTTQINQLLRDWSTAGESYNAMEARYRAKSNTDGAAVPVARSAASESARIYDTMVRTRLLSGSPEKSAQIAQLRKDWATSTGESWSDMMARWGVKRAADRDAAAACAAGGGADAPAPGADAGGAPGVPGTPGAPPSPPVEAEGGGLLGLSYWAWGAGGAVLLLGGALLIRKMKHKKAAAPALPK